MGRRGKGGPVDSLGAGRTPLDNVGKMCLDNAAFMIMASHPATSMLESVDKVFSAAPVDLKVEVTGVCIPLFDICYPRVLLFLALSNTASPTTLFLSLLRRSTSSALRSLWSWASSRRKMISRAMCSCTLA